MADKLSARGWHEKNCVKYWDFDPLSDGIVRNIHRLEEDYANYFTAELADENKRLSEENERLQGQIDDVADALGCKEKTSHRHSHGRCLYAGISKIEHCLCFIHKSGEILSKY